MVPGFAAWEWGRSRTDVSGAPAGGVPLTEAFVNSFVNRVTPGPLMNTYSERRTPHARPPTARGSSAPHTTVSESVRWALGRPPPLPRPTVRAGRQRWPQTDRRPPVISRVAEVPSATHAGIAGRPRRGEPSR